MNIEVNDAFKFASVWLTNEEKNSIQIKSILLPIIKEFRAKKYKFVIYESGKSDVLGLTQALLHHNRNLVANNM